MMKRLLFIFVTLVLVLLSSSIFSNYAHKFADIEERYNSSHTAVNLDEGCDGDVLANILYVNGYVGSEKEADFVAQQMVEKLRDDDRLGSLNDLNKRSWQLSVVELDSIYESDPRENAFLKRRLDAELDKIRVDEDYLALDVTELPSELVVDERCEGEIHVKVETKKSNASGLQQWLHRDGTASANVVVALSEYFLDSIDNAPRQRLVGYAKTNGDGWVFFKGLDLAKSYSVLPINKGFEYGVSKGTTQGSLAASGRDGILECSFVGKEHKIRLFDATTFKQIKDDCLITVRTPEEVKGIWIKYLIVFFVVWWSVYLIYIHKQKNIETGIISILMFLTGVCYLVMSSINNPLTDKLLGVQMAQGIVVGVIIIGVCLKINFITSHRIIKKSLDSDFYNSGFAYLALAIVLMVALMLFGSSVGGMKVNLNLFGLRFQPSEIVKYLVILFIAAFFEENGDSVVKYSESGKGRFFSKKLGVLLGLLLGLMVVIGCYVILGDMGPGLVLSFTFIIMYSIILSRGKIKESKNKVQLRYAKKRDYDIWSLIIGVVSFVAFLLVGRSIDMKGLFCVAWFIIWIVVGYRFKKQIYESAIMFNFIIAIFLFIGPILGNFEGTQDLSERFECRTEMCANTWGTLPIDGNKADAGVNTQVVHGLWGLASGGLWGQGLGMGLPSEIPAFHTDMILESIGEQLGFVWLVVIVLAFVALLILPLTKGDLLLTPFAFYWLMGIVVVTGVQFTIISLGSLGIMPLTGVAVPFLSYGKVSMIFNLMAFGVILSIIYHNEAEKKNVGSDGAKRSLENFMKKYRTPCFTISVCYVLLGCVVIGAFSYYQIIDRQHTLVRPVYVNNINGIPTIEYNPRINYVTQQMRAGDIYDRNKILLATSDKSKLSRYNRYYAQYGLQYDTIRRQRRYYPYGAHLYFMLGDYNNKLYFSSLDRSARGYMAEVRYMKELRGYDNRLRDDAGELVKVDLCSDEYRYNRYVVGNDTMRVENVQLRDYSKLIPYLEAGVYNNKIEYLSARKLRKLDTVSITPQDIQLTIDASLQTELQQELGRYVKSKANRKDWNKLRISAVVIDGYEGDLLASAVWPLPNYEILKEQTAPYSDNRRAKSWKAYTDMDLGLIYATPPGSTAKIMSALAGLRKLGVDVADKYNFDYRYKIDEKERVGLEPIGNLSMEDAVVRSSNCYFINLVNDNDLYSDLADIYATVGIDVNGERYYNLNYVDYDIASRWKNRVTDKSEGAISTYREYKASDNKRPMNLNSAWFWVWGQGSIGATPIAMARVASIVANKGEMPVTRYLMNQEVRQIPVVSREEAERLKLMMKKEAKEHSHFTNPNIGGKTGTAERVWYDSKSRRVKSNDGWYFCFIDNAIVLSDQYKKISPIVVAVRMERIHKGYSQEARIAVQEVVVPVLQNLGYLDYALQNEEGEMTKNL